MLDLYRFGLRLCVRPVGSNRQDCRPEKVRVNVTLETGRSQVGLAILIYSSLGWSLSKELSKIYPRG